ncbi:MAG: glycosyltransferase [Candidatus Omnitrophica bacterium]|nr:glycosyltransferase [Candidatus Omnitrophota bacterium]
MATVSVIIPSFNASGYIKRSLDSVLSQGYKEIEIIIVNDGSTDNLETVLASYMDDKRIKYVKTENRGVSHAINVGLGLAGGEYISFLHADDLFMRGKIGKQVAFMEAKRNCHISYTNENYFLDGTGYAVESRNFHFSGDIFYFLKRSNFIHMSTVMARRSALEGNALDEKLACHEEWDLFLRLAGNGMKFFYIDSILSSICVHSGNLSFDKNIMGVTRHEVGKRARALWGDFKNDINFYSINGINNFMRYAKFKMRAFCIGFPGNKKFNPRSPREILETMRLERKGITA